MASTYLQRTQTAGNRRKGTFSAWIKRSALAYNYLMSWNSTTSGTSYGDWIRFNGERLDVIKYTGSVVYRVQTNRLFRDTSAWYHIVVAYDSEQATASNRIKIYVNGVQETSFETSTYPSEDYDFEFNNNSIVACVGKNYNTEAPFDGLMSHVHFIDGTAYDASAFGETDATTGEWKAKTSPSVTYGTNGFFILKDGNGITDQSGEGNDFTLGGGTLTDLKDNPDNVFATLNPLNSTANGTEPTYSVGNLQSVSPSSGGGFVGSSTLGASSGKYYFEIQRSAGSSSNVYIGIGDETSTPEIARQSASAIYAGNQVFYKPDDGNKVIVTNGSGAETSYGAAYGNGDIIGIALNMDNNQVTFYKDGASQGAISIPTPNGACFLNVINGADTADTFQVNFGNGYFGTTAITTNSGNGYSGAEGSSKFNYTVPTGYSALSTKGLNE